MANISQSRRKARKAKSRDGRWWIWGFVLLVAVGSTGCKKAPNVASKDSNAPQVKSVLHLEPFVVNLADPEDNRFLRVGIDLGLETSPSTKEGKEGGVPTSRVRDCILAVLSTWRSDALLAPEGKQKLKDELIHALRAHAPELEVKEVYFTDFLVQR